jgi:hypothetical protein
MTSQNARDEDEQGYVGRSVVFAPTDEMEKFKGLMAKLNIKAKSFGLAPIEVVSQQPSLYRRNGQEVKDGLGYVVSLTPATQADLLDRRADLIELQRIVITNPLIKLGDWRVVGRLEREPVSGESLSFQVSHNFNDNEAMEAYRVDPITCEHCNTKRQRAQSYVLTNDRGEYKQVGTACLEDFTGISPERLLFLANFNRFIKIYDPDHEGFGVGRQRIIGTQAYLADVSFLSTVGGFISSAKAREGYGLSPTYSDALRINLLLRDNDSLRERYVQERPSHLQHAANIINWFRDKTLPVDSFTRNVQILICKETLATENRHLAFAAAAVPTYFKAMQEHKPSLTLPPSGYQGSVGDKIERSLIIEKVVPLESRFGNPHLVLFRDTDGNAYKWKAAAPALEIIEGEGLKLKASMKVKAHEEYRGSQQTSVSHLKLIAWEQVHEQLLRVLQGDTLLSHRRSRDHFERLVPSLEMEEALLVKTAVFNEMKASWPGKEWVDELAKAESHRDRYHSIAWGYVAENDTDRYLVIGHLNRRLDELRVQQEQVKSSANQSAEKNYLPPASTGVSLSKDYEAEQPSFNY